jgi:hypothetical protein
MSGRCPGQDGRDLKVSTHTCSYCGGEVEMFSDETRVKCPSCGEYVCKEQLPSCVAWCAKARECLGEERWAALKGEAPGTEQQGEGKGGDDV